MKTMTSTIYAITILSALSITAYAQNVDNPGKGPGGKHRGGPPKILLDKFDKDGDGKLNEEERSEIRKEFMKRREANKARRLERFDTDKDGELSAEEKEAAKPVLIEERKQIKESVLKEFDKDGDGKLSPEERKGTREWILKNHPDAVFMPPRDKGLIGKGGPLRKCPKAEKKEASNSPQREDQAAQ